ncbi:PREDICTED: heparan-alpha-glucosaminide N-acetyltransferase [Nicrophorus vespilloides]|uniref:Heparan-alpha-glucosaminide N-acetyltransferase n=1 Tax=Nicrophorus vespilloides TaxID=110193 RepID=A0ABM1MRC4_NICVS|nr:PREDICTED: heparan-alpha-glucosaminide N-acetyltransferase [Nicrophorus vespilloides]
MGEWLESYGEEMFLGEYNMSKLRMDDCYLTVDNQVYEGELYLHSRFVECEACPLLPESDEPIYKGVPKTFIINTAHDKYYKIRGLDDDVPIYQEFRTLKEFGVYKFDHLPHLIEVKTLKEPVNIYFPILTVFLIFACIFLLIPIGKFLWKRYKLKRSDLPAAAVEEKAKSKSRLKSLDTFRGMCIVLMIFVNYGHGSYEFIEHAVWNGLTVADLVFPCFMWIMGVCVPIAMKSAMKKSIPKPKIFLNIFRRSCILFALGLFLNAGRYLDTLRVFGVLQRFGICYFVVATVCLFEAKPDNSTSNNVWSRRFKYILSVKYQWIFMLILLSAYILILVFLQEPGCEAFYLGPGGYHDNGTHFNCTGGATGYIDRLILGKHVYQRAEIINVYQALPHDPEGILGCLPSIFHVFLGVQAGAILQAHKGHKRRLALWLVWAAISGIIGGLLCNFSKDDGLIPVNKNLWSLSFVFVTTCIAYIVLSACYLIIDVLKFWTGKPFLFAGMNAIFLYVGHSLIHTNFPFHWYVSHDHENSTHFWLLLKNVWATSLWVLVSFYLYKIKFFLSI